MKAYFPASTCEDSCEYLRGRLQVLAGKVASISVKDVVCTARTDAVHCEDGCSALQDGLQCTAGRVAAHCV